MESNLVVKTIPITRMDCPSCIPVLEREVERLEGVEDIRGNYMAKNLKITYDPERVQLADIEAAVERVGYRISYKRYPGVLSRIRRLLAKEEGRVESISDGEFPGKVLHASRAVAVMFSSPTCPTCKVFKSLYEKLAEKAEGMAVLYEMDISSTETWRDYDILSIPMVLVFKTGKVVERFTALPRIEEISRALGI